MFQHEKATAATTRVRQGMSTLFGEITRVLTIPHDDDTAQADGTVATPGGPVFDRARVGLLVYAIL